MCVSSKIGYNVIITFILLGGMIFSLCVNVCNIFCLLNVTWVLCRVNVFVVNVFFVIYIICYQMLL